MFTDQITVHENCKKPRNITAEGSVNEYYTYQKFCINVIVCVFDRSVNDSQGTKDLFHIKLRQQITLHEHSIFLKLNIV